MKVGNRQDFYFENPEFKRSGFFFGCLAGEKMDGPCLELGQSLDSFRVSCEALLA